MKVLDAKPWLHFTGRGCKSKLEADVSDVKCHAGRDISGCYEENYYVKCPVCGTERSLSYEEAPPIARKKHS